jgi:hypothetical protein
LRHGNVYDAILRIRRKTDRPLEPVKMEIATANRLEFRLIRKNDPTEGAGDLLTKSLPPFRKHVENAGPAVEAKRCFPGWPESAACRPIFAELQTGFGELFNVDRVLDQVIAWTYQRSLSGSLKNVDQHLSARAVESFE